jgi:hypothetical protein
MRPWFFLLVVGCAQAPPAPPAAELGSPTGQAAPLPDALPPSAQEEVCLTLQRAFQARLDTAAGRCTTDFDCGCYRGVAPGLGCGGITDFKSSVALAGLTTQFVQASCAFPNDCGPSQCLAVCAEGKCAPMPIKL